MCALAACGFTPARGGDRNQIGEDGSRYQAPTSNIFMRRTLASAASSGLPSVAIVASASGDVTDPWFSDPHDRLVMSGAFSSVTILHAGETTPTPAQLSAFDAVIVWSNFAFADDGALGDALADYVNAGGGVVLATFADSSETAGRSLGGRWTSHEYEVIPSASGTAVGPATLGTILEPGHPIMQGVASFSGGSSSFRPATTSTAASAQKIALWDDGATLVAVRDDAVGSLVDLGFYPPSDDVLAGFWDASTDGALLIENALVYAAQRVPLIPGDSDADQDVDLDDFARFSDCFTGINKGQANANCVTFDFDCDDDVDCFDWFAFEAAWTEPTDPPVFKCPLEAGPNPFAVAGGEMLNRTGGLAMPASAVAGGEEVAIRIRLIDLYVDMNEDPVSGCPVRAGGLPDLSLLDGKVRYLGPPSAFDDNDTVSTPQFVAAELQCTPFYRDWSPAALTADFGAGVDTGTFYFYGAEVLPCSVYEAQQGTQACVESASEDCFSAALEIRTALWGDVWTPFGDVSFTDIGKMVEAFKGIAFVEGDPPDGAPRKVRVMLRENSAPFGLKINFNDIGNIVNAFKTIAYAEDGPTACP